MKTYLGISMPTRHTEAVELAKKVIDKHNELGNSSPLLGYDVSTFEQILALSAQLDILVDKMRATLGKKTQEKVLLLGYGEDQTLRTKGTLRHGLASIRDMLTGFYKGSERAIAEWGYTVVFHTGSSGNQSREDDIIIEVPSDTSSQNTGSEDDSSINPAPSSGNEDGMDS